MSKETLIPAIADQIHYRLYDSSLHSVCTCVGTVMHKNLLERDTRLANMIYRTIYAEIRKEIVEEINNGHFVTVTKANWVIEHSADCKLSCTTHTCRYHQLVRDKYQNQFGSMRGRYLMTEVGPGLLSFDRAGGANSEES